MRLQSTLSIEKLDPSDAVSVDVMFDIMTFWQYAMC